MQLGASLSFTPEDMRKEPVCLSPWKIQGRSQFVFHHRRCKEGASVFNPGRYKEGASLSFTPEDTRRSQCVFHPRRCKEGASVFHPGRYREGASLFFTPGCGGWGWPAIEDGWVGQQWEHSTSWCDWGLREFQTVPVVLPPQLWWTECNASLFGIVLVFQTGWFWWTQSTWRIARCTHTSLLPSAMGVKIWMFWGWPFAKISTCLPCRWVLPERRWKMCSWKWGYVKSFRVG